MGEGMSNELNDTQAAGGATGNPGQAGDSGANAGDGNLANNADFRRWQADADRRLNEANRNAQQALQRAYQAENKAAVYEQLISQADPEVARGALAEAELAELRAFKDRAVREQEHNERWKEFYNLVLRKCSRAGVDINSMQVKSVMNSWRGAESTVALLDQIDDVVERLRSASVTAQTQAPTSVPAPSGGGLPPQGGLRINEQQVLMQEYEERKKKLQGDAEELVLLKREMRAKGLELPR